jgi:hypothetical protein
MIEDIDQTILSPGKVLARKRYISVSKIYLFSVHILRNFREFDASYMAAHFCQLKCCPIRNPGIYDPFYLILVYNG